VSGLAHRGSSLWLDARSRSSFWLEAGSAGAGVCDDRASAHHEIDSDGRWDAEQSAGWALTAAGRRGDGTAERDDTVR